MDDASPFDDAEEDAIDALLNTSAAPTDLINEILALTSATSNASRNPVPAPMVEELDPGEITMPELGRGKQRKVQVRRYGNDTAL
jgi:hypothetical protein